MAKSLFGDYELNEENFERCIINMLTMPQILIVFRKKIIEMDEWCKKTYGGDFESSYLLVKSIAIEKFTQTVQSLGLRGNPTALNIIDRMLNSNIDDRTVKIVFTGMEKEKEEDK